MVERVSIFPYPDVDSLVISLTEILGDRRPEPLPLPVVTPSLLFSDYLQLRIAERFGVCMGLNFLMPQDFIRHALELSDNPWSNRNLTWQILPHLAPYAKILGVEDPSLRDQLALSGMLADRFDQYGHFRPDIIRRWASGKFTLPSTSPSSEGEGWQYALWKQLEKEIPFPHPALKLAELRTNAGFLSRLKESFPRLIVLTSGSLDPLLMEVLQLHAEAGCEVSLHVTLPSLDYLGDLRRRKELPPETVDPETIEVSGGHPLLESMGRQSVGSFVLLGKLDEQYTHWPERQEQDSINPSLLKRLQSDIRNLREPVSGPVPSTDISLRVHSCFGPRREMEVLRDELLRAFQDIEGLKPQDIHIVTASLETYAPLISATMEHESSRLPVHATELPSSGRPPVIEGLLALLELAHGVRYEASHLLELLQLRAVQSSLRIPDDDKQLDLLRIWIRDSGLMQGLGNDHDEPGTWMFARDRLIAGRWFGTDDRQKYPDARFVLPVCDLLGGDQDLRERFIAWHFLLQETLEEWGHTATPSEWGERLEMACERLLGGTDDSRLPVIPHLAFLLSLKCEEQTDSGALLDWLETDCAETGSRTSISGRIKLGRFKQLQNIPCRVLAMVGMQDKIFPGRNRTPAWDLLQHDPRIWDRNARVEDRQLFLDALLTPTDRLIITASTRNVRSRKTEPFSSCVDELLRVTQCMGGAREQLVVEHRLQPFSADYFQTPSPLPHSFSTHYAETAGLVLGEKSASGIPFWDNNASPSSREVSELSISQLIDFWKDPARAFLKSQGISPPFEENEDFDYPPFTLGGLESWKLKHAVLQEILLGDGNLPHTAAALQANRGLPPAALGDCVWNSRRPPAEQLANEVMALPGEYRPVHFILSDPAIRITDSLLISSDQQALLSYRIGKMTEPADFFSPWIQAILAACAGWEMPTVLLHGANPVVKEERAAIPFESAEYLLHRLVQGYLIGQARPLCFGLETSEALIVGIQNNEPDALHSAMGAWNIDSGYKTGEGHKPSAQLVWRDRDAFEDSESWIHWAETISGPLHTWRTES